MFEKRPTKGIIMKIFYSLIFFIGVTSCLNNLNAMLKLPPLRQTPHKDKQSQLERLFFKELQRKNITAIEELLKKHPALANAECCQYFDRKRLKKNYYPPLFFALDVGFFDIAQLLISHDADINWKNENGSFLLDIFWQRHKPEMIALLTRAGALTNR